MTDNSFCNLRTMSSPSYMKWTNYFTIIELLVVISIIAILVSILLPALKTARDKVRGTVCLSNLKQCGYNMTMYANDFDEYIVPPIPSDSAGNDISWGKFYFEYLNPETLSTSTGDGKKRVMRALATMHCPMVEWNDGQGLSLLNQIYGANFTLFGGFNTGDGISGFWGKKRPLRRINIKMSNPTLAQAHKTQPLKSVLYIDSLWEPENVPTLKSPAMCYTVGFHGSIGLLHHLKANALLLDGSVISSGRDQLKNSYGLTISMRNPFELQFQ